MRILTILLLVAVLIIGISFASLNASTISVNYLIGKKDMPLVVVMFINFVFGFLFCYLIMFWKVLKLKAKLHSAKSKAKEAEEKLSKVKEAT